ncbi:MAG: SDR family NAD(P)-dependent oxidoreductase [Bacteroidota bacterium]
MANADKAKVYVITGASRGIGRDTIIEIARTERATRILAMARSVEKLSELEEELSGVSQCDLHTMAVDLTVPEQSQIAAWLDEFGPVDGLLNNAGLLINRPFEELDEADWRALMEVNLMAPARLVRLMIPYFRRSEPNAEPQDSGSGAHIVNVSSMGGYQGAAKFPGLSAYSASKGALAILSECLAEELKDRHISVNCLSLGAVQTEMLAQAFPGYQAPLGSQKMAEYFAWFLQFGHQFFNGKVLPVSISTP